MGAIILRPVLTERQVSTTELAQIRDYVGRCLPANLNDLEDIDELMLDGSVRVCVGFSIDRLGRLVLVSAEILNSDWDALETDSFALSQHLKPIIKDYNNRAIEAFTQTKDIKEERLCLT